ncbi:glycine zipper family protein [Methylobacter tundripaludum]|uniref:glycine zipper family protein n=1 Tax=Methylobacter tundripaludum TaxID=173365 RepID=UPI0004DF6469|nr:glycine zipper family protein [Methylobacter tundripaludum]
MRRIYFLVPNIAITHKIVEELQAEGIEDRHIHILAKRDTPLEGLPEAGISIKTDFLPAVERGVALGGSTGLLAGLIGLRFAGFAIAGGPLLGIIMAGATIGSLMGGLAGMNSGNSRLRQFEEAIERGELLVLIDIPRDRIEAIRKLVIKHHPEAEFEGIEPILPPSY